MGPMSRMVWSVRQLDLSWFGEDGGVTNLDLESFGEVVWVGEFPSGVSSPLTFGVTVLEGDGPLMFGGEAPTTREAQSPSCFRLVGATWT